jgi:hypothetical protein
MASPASSYRESTEPQSGKASRFQLPSQVQSSSLPPRLRNTLSCILKHDRFGTQLWVSVTRTRVEAGVCRRTVQYHLRKLEKLNVLSLVHPANSYIGREFRRSATYRVNQEYLSPRQTWQDYENKRAADHRSSQRSRQQKESPKPSAPGPVPVSSAPTQSHRASQRPMRGLRKGEVKVLIARMRELMTQKRRVQVPAGSSMLKLARAPAAPDIAAVPDAWAEILKFLANRIDRHGYDTWLKPARYSHAEGNVLFVSVPTSEFAHVGEKYRDLIQEAITSLGLGYEEVTLLWPQHESAQGAPMNQQSALAEVCSRLGFRVESAVEALKLSPYTIEQMET